MQWETLLSQERQRGYRGNRTSGRQTDLRSEFEKDYHRIIGSASFRRLQDKTQVFPLDKSDFIRTRLTHSLEVSSFAKSLGQNIAENILAYKKDDHFKPKMKEDMCNILQCAGLIHDIGNPPFGHFGEMIIRSWFENNLPKLLYHGKPVTEALSERMRQDFFNFEGNAQALRLVTKLHFLVDEQGMNLTYGLLNTIIKYPISSDAIDKKSGNIKDKKMGYYHADEEIFKEITRSTGAGDKRHPLTFILEAADDIAYKTADIEDAFVKGMLSYQTLYDELKELQDTYGKDAEVFKAADKLAELYMRGKEKHLSNPYEYAVKNWIIRVQGFMINCATFGFTSNYDQIMAGEYKKDLFYKTYAKRLMALLGDLAYREVFTSDVIYRMEVAESAMLNYLLDAFMPAVVKYDDHDEIQDAIGLRMVSFISDNYKNAYHFHARGKSPEERLYLRLLLATDYICGMTDSYAKRLYQELTGVTPP